MGERLPAAARSHPEWPIRLDHCFGRVVLDTVCGRPWREVLKPPAWRHMDAEALARAIALAERIADSREDLAELNRRSLEMRGKLRARPDSPFSRDLRRAPASHRSAQIRLPRT